MRKILYTLCIIAGGVGTVAALISGHLMEDQRRHIAYWWLLLCIPLTLLGLIPTIVNVWREPHPEKTAKLQRGWRDERRAFGVYWDSHLNPLCPACGTPLTLSRDKLIYRIDGGVPLPLPEPHCFSCDKLVPLHDDDGNHITLGEAKKLLSPKEAKTEIEFPKQQPLQLQTSDAPQTPEPDTYQPVDIDKKIISYLCREGVDRLPRFIARFVGVDVIDIEIRLHQLISNGYVRRPRTSSTKPFADYGLTVKGKQFAIDNDLLSEQKPNTWPDELAVKVLLYIARSDYGDLTAELSKAFNLEPLVIAHCVDQLIEQDFVSEDQYAPLRGDNEYSLTPKGRDYLVKNAPIKKPKEPIAKSPPP